MGLSMGEEISVFLNAVGLGMVFGVAYEFLRAAEYLQRRCRWLVVVLDVGYFFLCGVAGFLFFLVMLDGEVRWYPLFGFFVGGVAFYGTVGKWTLGVLCRFFRWMARLGGRLRRKILSEGKRCWNSLTKGQKNRKKV